MESSWSSCPSLPMPQRWSACGVPVTDFRVTREECKTLCLLSLSLCVCVFRFCNAGDGAQGLAHARKMPSPSYTWRTDGNFRCCSSGTSHLVFDWVLPPSPWPGAQQVGQSASDICLFPPLQDRVLTGFCHAQLFKTNKQKTIKYGCWAVNSGPSAFQANVLSQRHHPSPVLLVFIV